MRQVLQEAHETGDGESNIWFYNWNARCKRLDILDGPTTAQAQEGTAGSVVTGSIGTSVSRVFNRTNKNGLLHGNGLHLIKEPIEATGLKKEAEGRAGDQPTPRLDH
jgi:hypothetical protein